MLQRLIAIGVVTITLALSVQLVNTKKDVAALRAQVAHSSHAFVRGLPLPPMVLRLANDQAITLPSMCAAGRPLVLFFTTRQCPECQRLLPAWQSVTRSRTNLQFVIASVEGEVPAASDAGEATPAVTSRVQVMQTRLSMPPAVILTNGRCQISAAAAGELASRMLSESLSDAPGSH